MYPKQKKRVKTVKILLKTLKGRKTVISDKTPKNESKQ